jgi:hypothetical protein
MICRNCGFEGGYAFFVRHEPLQRNQLRHAVRRINLSVPQHFSRAPGRLLPRRVSDHNFKIATRFLRAESCAGQISVPKTLAYPAGTVRRFRPTAGGSKNPGIRQKNIGIESSIVPFWAVLNCHQSGTWASAASLASGGNRLELCVWLMRNRESSGSGMLSGW